MGDNGHRLLWSDLSEDVDTTDDLREDVPLAGSVVTSVRSGNGEEELGEVVERPRRGALEVDIVLTRSFSMSSW